MTPPDTTLSRLTPDELAELKRLHEAATAQPWHVSDRNWRGEVDEHGRLYVSGDCRSNFEEDDEGNVTERGFVATGVAMFAGDSRNCSEAKANADLLCAVRNALPRLLAAAERAVELEGEVERLKAETRTNIDAHKRLIKSMLYEAVGIDTEEQAVAAVRDLRAERDALRDHVARDRERIAGLHQTTLSLRTKLGAKLAAVREYAKALADGGPIDRTISAHLRRILDGDGQ